MQRLACHISEQKNIEYLETSYPSFKTFADILQKSSFQIRNWPLMLKKLTWESTQMVQLNMYRGVSGVQMHPPSWVNYFKIMQFFTRNLSLDPSFWPQHRGFLKRPTPLCKIPEIRTPYVRACDFCDFWYTRYMFFLSFTRYCIRSCLTIMAGVGVAHKLLKK